MGFHVQNPQGIAVPLTVFTLCLPGAAMAQQSVRSYVERTCGTQLAAYEAALGKASSFWQLSRATEERPVTPDRLAIGTWSASAYPLIDAIVMAKSAVRAPQHRGAVAARLGTALDLTNCLSPSSAQWDKAGKSEPPAFIAEARSVECFAESATILKDALASGLEGEVLNHVFQEQMQAMQMACKSEE